VDFASWPTITAGGASGGGDDEGFTGLRLANFEEAENGGEPLMPRRFRKLGVGEERDAGKSLGKGTRFLLAGRRGIGCALSSKLPSIPFLSDTNFLNLLGINGLTAYFRPPRSGAAIRETLVVSAAAGPPAVSSASSAKSMRLAASSASPALDEKW